MLVITRVENNRKYY